MLTFPDGAIELDEEGRITSVDARIGRAAWTMVHDLRPPQGCEAGCPRYAGPVDPVNRRFAVGYPPRILHDNANRIIAFDFYPDADVVQSAVMGSLCFSFDGAGHLLRISAANANASSASR